MSTPPTGTAQMSSAVSLTRLPPLQATCASRLRVRSPRTTFDYHEFFEKPVKQFCHGNHLQSARNRL